MKDETKYRLPDSTAVEPLVNQWFAWSSTIAPVPASLHLVHYQVPLLESYLSDPDLHLEASQNPEFVGGPFIGISPQKKEHVMRLLDETNKKLKPTLRWAKEIFEFLNYLVQEAHGQSLEPFYQRVPDSLRGFVELFYDYYHRPSIRFLESLLYKSDYYRQDLQSLRLMPNLNDSSKKYFLNTPRIPQDDHLDWNISFKDSDVDQLFALSANPQPLRYIRELLHVSESVTDEQLSSLFSVDPVPQRADWNEPQVRYRYFGHACVLVEYKGTSILVDPFIPLVALEGGHARFSYADLPPKIDYALITHNHQDHFNLECLLRLRCRIGCLVVPRSFSVLYGDISLKKMAQALGFKNVIELDTLESISIPDGAIISTPFFGEHSDILHAKTSYVVRTGKRQTLFGADSDCLEREIYVRTVKDIGRIDTAFLGMESEGAPLSFGYGSLFPQKIAREYDETRRQHGCNAVRGLEIIKTIGANRIYNYAMGLEPWTKYILGLELSQDSPQWQESEKLLSAIRGSGDVVAQRLYCKYECVVEDEPDHGTLTFAGTPAAETATAKDEEEQFSF